MERHGEQDGLTMTEVSASQTFIVSDDDVGAKKKIAKVPYIPALGQKSSD